MFGSYGFGLADFPFPGEGGGSGPGLGLFGRFGQTHGRGGKAAPALKTTLDKVPVEYLILLSFTTHTEVSYRISIQRCFSLGRRGEIQADVVRDRDDPRQLPQDLCCC